MELLCPNCQKRLTIPDQYAGKRLKCPLCAGEFEAPATPGAPPILPTPAHVPPPPAPAPRGGFDLEPTPHAPPPVLSPAPASNIPMEPTAPPPPPVPPGDYRHIFTVNANPDIVPLIAPVGLTVMFLLSFFPAIAFNFLGNLPGQLAQANLPPSIWSLAFDSFHGSMAIFLPYVVFTFILAWPLSIAGVLKDKQIIPLIPAIEPYMAKRSLIIGVLALIGFLPLLLIWIYWLFHAMPTTPWFKLLVRVHEVVLIGLALDIWLQHRKKGNLPSPKMDLRW